ncbi:MAG: ATP-binding protein [Akkermansiaceae bacterium]
MLKILLTVGTALLAGLFLHACNGKDDTLTSTDIPGIEQRLSNIDHQLKELAQPSLRGGIGAIGYRSMSHITGDHTEWIKIDLGIERSIDEVVLVPLLYRDSKLGFTAHAFPHSFRIIAGTDNDSAGTVIADYPSTEHLLPRVAPLVVQVKEGTKASWIKIEATLLGARFFDKRYVLQLSEILVFSGEENVALRQPVTASSNQNERLESAWGSRFLTDGNVPYLMDGSLGKKSIAYVSQKARNPHLTVDLGEPIAISGIHLHAVEQSDTVPQAHPGNFGIPVHLKIEAANLADFSDATELLHFQFKSLENIGPLIMWQLPETSCRYVRLTDANPESQFFQIGFTEIEVLSEGINVALAKPISGTGTHRPDTRSFKALTDGSNLYGEILPVRTWMKQLQLRHDLEIERPQVIAQLTTQYEKQSTNLKLAAWLIAFLLAGGIILVLIQKVARQRAIFETRERIAANLHDELGANLYAIGLFGNLAKQEVEEHNNDGKWSKLMKYTDTVCDLTKETGETASYCTNLLAAKDIYADLSGEMKRLADRLLADMYYTITITDEEIIRSLSPRRRNGFFRFYKECLTNILRHSGATRVKIHLSAHSGKLQLSVTDNGTGVGELQPPASLKRRARLLGGKVTIEKPQNGGTCITLQIRPKKFLKLSF